MIAHPLRRADGGLLLPGNRWDLVRTPLVEPEVTVIVPFYQNRRQLDLLLEGLKLQQYPAARFEVVMADDGSPEPLKISAMDAGGLRIRVVRQEDRGFRAAAARNLAARSAEGSVLCFLDQDTIPAPGYLRAITRLPAVVPEAVVVGKREHVDLTNWSPANVHHWLSGTGEAPDRYAAPRWLAEAYRSSANLLRADRFSYQYLISAVLACSREFFAELGGFDEGFTEYGGEDWELAHRAWNLGALLAHEPAAVAWHDGPDWAGRGTPQEREAAKQREAQALLRRIPEETGPTPPDQPANVLLSWTDTDGIEVSETLPDLLGSPLNLAVYLEEPPGLVHPRLRVGEPSKTERAQARYQMTLQGPPGADLPGRLERVLKHLREPDAGQVILTDPRLRAVTSRAEARATRWQPCFPDRDLLGDLFSRIDQRVPPTLG